MSPVSSRCGSHDEERVDPSKARRARIRRRRTAAQPASGSRSETGTRVRRLERAEQSARQSEDHRAPAVEPAGVDPERAPKPAERSDLHPARAKDDGSSAHDASEPGVSFESRALAVEPAGVEPVAARRTGLDLSSSRETAYSPRAHGCVTLTVTPHGRSRYSARWARVHPANAGPQNELTSSTLIPALSLSFGFGPTWIRTSMSRALRNRSRRSMLNRASLPRTRSDTSG
jgi:hypothetical protein